MEEFVSLVDSFQLDPVIADVIPAVIFLLGCLLSWGPLLRMRAYERLQKNICGLGKEFLRDVYVPGGIDGRIYLEYLLLTPAGLLLFHVKPYYGNIFAGEQIEFWTQVIGHHSFKFANPLHQLQTTLGELHAEFPKASLEGRVLFTAGSRFPKGKPPQVYQVEDIRSLQQRDSQPIPEQLQAAWQKLRESAVPANQIRMDIYLRRGDRRRLFYGVLCLTIGLASSGWMLLR